MVCCGGVLSLERDQAVIKDSLTGYLKPKALSKVNLAALWENLDKSRYFKLASIDRIIQHYDGPVAQGCNNLWLWRDGSTKNFQILPWGIDQTFKPKVNGAGILLKKHPCLPACRFDAFHPTCQPLPPHSTANCFTWRRYAELL